MPSETPKEPSEVVIPLDEDTAYDTESVVGSSGYEETEEDIEVDEEVVVGEPRALPRKRPSKEEGKRKRKGACVVLPAATERMLGEWLEDEADFIYDKGRKDHADRDKVFRAFSDKAKSLDTPITGPQLKQWFDSIRSRFGRLSNLERRRLSGPRSEELVWCVILCPARTWKTRTTSRRSSQPEWPRPHAQSVRAAGPARSVSGVVRYGGGGRGLIVSSLCIPAARGDLTSGSARHRPASTEWCGSDGPSRQTGRMGLGNMPKTL